MVNNIMKICKANMNARQITNWLLYGNPKGQPTHTGKSSNEYDDFIKKIFNYNKKYERKNNSDRKEV